MKLLQEVVRLCTAGKYGASARGTDGLPQFRVTVPASLVTPAADSATLVALPDALAVRAVPARSEPRSFLKAPRHLRQVSSR